MRTAPLLVLLLLTACSGHPPRVAQFGATREVLRGGQSQPRVHLAEFVTPNTIAVGALAGLEGEITVLDGQTWVARRDGLALTVTGPAPDPADHATLLTAAKVGAWQTEEVISTNPTPDHAPDAFIEWAARASGIDTTKPFPFTITADFDTLDLHVIHGACPIANPDLPPESRPWRWSAAGTPVHATIVGFYAPDAAGVMTHHGTAIHAHAIIGRDGEIITGHVERFTLPTHATLGLPEPR